MIGVSLVVVGLTVIGAEIWLVIIGTPVWLAAVMIVMTASLLGRVAREVWEDWS